MEEYSSRSNEIKVGLFTIIGLVVICAIAIFVGNIDIGGPKGYQMKVYFKNADGLDTGNQVRYAGVRAGRVEEVVLLPNGVSATIRIESDLQIPRDAVFTLGSDGIMGSKFVTIQPPDRPSGEYWSKGAEVKGIAPPGIDDVMASANDLVLELNSIVSNMNEVIGSDETKLAIQTAMINIGVISENLKMASESLSRVSAASESDLLAIVSNLRSTSDDVKHMSSTANQMLTTIDDNGTGAQEIRQMISDMNKVTSRLDRITASVENLATDPKVIDDVKNTIHNASETSGKINRLLGSTSGNSTGTENVSSTKGTSSRPFFDGGVDFTYSPSHGESDWRGDANVTLGGEKFVRVGAQDIGEDNNLELQGGFWKGPVGFRAGVFESKLGVGLDWMVSDWLTLSLDGYDPNDFQYRVRGEVGLGKSKKTSLIAQMYGHDRSTTTYFGLRQRF